MLRDHHHHYYFRKLFLTLKALRYRKQIQHKGPVILSIKGEIKGKLHLGEHYGIRTLAPSVVSVERMGKVEINGLAYFYGDNIIRVRVGGKLSIGDQTRINIQTGLYVKQEILIGKDCLISQGVYIRDNDGHKINGGEGVAPIFINDHVWIGYGATILKGVTIGTGSVIAARSVVIRDVPDHSIVGGNPAKVLKSNITWETE